MSPLENATISPPVRDFIFNEMKSVEGYLSEGEAVLFAVLDAHQRKVEIKGDIAEFGIWRGRSALVLYQLLRETEKLRAIDIFDLRSPDHPFFNDPAIFEGHCERLGAKQRMHVIKADTTLSNSEITAAIPPHSCRIVHVDGGHTYKVAKVDVDHAFRAVSEDGVVVCDDILAKKFPGVTQAYVEAIQANPDFVPIALTKKKIWSVHRRNAEAYKATIREATAKKWSSSYFMGGNMMTLT